MGEYKKQGVVQLPGFDLTRLLLSVLLLFITLGELQYVHKVWDLRCLSFSCILLLSQAENRKARGAADWALE